MNKKGGFMESVLFLAIWLMLMSFCIWGIVAAWRHIL
jgi:hypothetical protein